MDNVGPPDACSIFHINVCVHMDTCIKDISEFGYLIQNPD